MVGTPYKQIGMAVVDPLKTSMSGYTHILVIVDYATQDHEAIPLCLTNTPAIADKLLSWVFVRVGIP